MCEVLIKIQESDTYIKCFNWCLLALYSKFLGSSLKLIFQLNLAAPLLRSFLFWNDVELCIFWYIPIFSKAIIDIN